MTLALYFLGMGLMLYICSDPAAGMTKLQTVFSLITWPFFAVIFAFQVLSDWWQE